MLQDAVAVSIKMFLPESGGRSKLPLLHWLSAYTKSFSLRPPSQIHVPAVKTLLGFWELHVQYFSWTGEKGWPEGTIWAFKMEKQDGQASAEPPSFPTAAQFSHTLSFNSKGGYKVPDTCPFPEGIIQEHWCRLREPEKTRMRKKLTPELGRKNFCREVDRIHT